MRDLLLTIHRGLDRLGQGASGWAVLAAVLGMNLALLAMALGVPFIVATWAADATGLGLVVGGPVFLLLFLWGACYVAPHVQPKLGEAMKALDFTRP